MSSGASNKLPPVVFEDNWFIAFNKPAGLLTAPDRWDKDLANLMNAIHRHLSPAYFNAHRLDRDTSGVLLCAKDRPTLSAICRLIERREVQKTYLALVRGQPAEKTGRVELPVAPDFGRPGRMIIRRHGRPCVTEFETLESWRHHTLIQARPLTGRTHQIRLHLKSLGCPILGDDLYGNGQGLFLSEIKKKYKQKEEAERPLIGRLALHAQRFEFIHPVENQPVIVEAPLSKDFEIALKYLRRFGA